MQVFQRLRYEERKLAINRRSSVINSSGKNNIAILTRRAEVKTLNPKNASMNYSHGNTGLENARRNDNMASEGAQI